MSIFNQQFTMAFLRQPSPKYFSITAPAEHVAHVEINRPEKMNAFFDPMWYELRDIFKHLSANPDVRCILLSGAGERAFTAGKHFHVGTSHNLTSQVSMYSKLRPAAQQRRSFQIRLGKQQPCAGTSLSTRT